MPAHQAFHLTWTVGFIGVLAALLLVVRTQAVRRRILFALAVLLGAVAVHTATVELPQLEWFAAHGGRVEGLLTAFGVITVLVALVFNPWFKERPGETTPAIVQDTVVTVLLVIAAMFVFHDTNFFVGLTGSAIVVGLALQDTLGNAFAGLAIQVEKPFRVGHWILTAGYEGRVVEVTWRATKIRTKLGNLVMLPNSVVAKEAINNYSEPTPQTRLDRGRRRGVRRAAEQGPRGDSRRHSTGRRSWSMTPEPDVLLHEFGDSAIIYRARFWITEFEKDVDRVRSGAPRNLLRVRAPGHRDSVADSRALQPRGTARARRRSVRIGTRGSSRACPCSPRSMPKGSARSRVPREERVYGDGETIVSEGDKSASMFIVCRGEVAILVGGGREVARTGEGGYFGEMSLLTGEPRSATVVARDDCTVLEIGAEAFKAYVTSHPDVIEQLAQVAAGRRRKLDETRAAAANAGEAHRSLADRMRRFFGLA